MHHLLLLTWCKTTLLVPMKRVFSYRCIAKEVHRERTYHLFIKYICRKKWCSRKIMNLLPVCRVVFLNSKNQSFPEISEKGKLSKTALFTIKVGLWRGLLKKLNQFFDTIIGFYSKFSFTAEKTTTTNKRPTH